MPVSIEEFAGSPIWTSSPTDETCTRRLRVPGSERAAFLQELFPPPFSSLIPRLPALLTDRLYAKSASFKPQLGDEALIASYGPPNVHDWLEVEVVYANTPYHQDNDGENPTGQIYTRSKSYGSILQTIPQIGLKWLDNGNRIDLPEFRATQIISTINHTIRLHRVTQDYYDLLDEAISGLAGKVNDDEFEGVAAGFLLFNGGETEENASIEDNEYTVTLSFSERRIKQNPLADWNFLFDPQTGAWREVRTMDNKPLYVLGDFGNLYG